MSCSKLILEPLSSYDAMLTPSAPDGRRRFRVIEGESIIGPISQPVGAPQYIGRKAHRATAGSIGISGSSSMGSMLIRWYGPVSTHSGLI